MACNPVERITSGCKDADQGVVDEVMETADPDKKLVDRIEFVRAKTIGLPDDMQKFDFDQIMVITIAQWFTEAESSDLLPGKEQVTTFVLSSETDEVAPIDEFAEKSFSLTNPVQDDPEWDSWVDSITYSDPFDAIRGCARSD
ncbi:hypothetical protein FB381_0012 [Nocardioides albertanoniae]|uniref:Uncharacterized protein n=2 Tax=Nocardioides albertanoniae TaxID=1175486 RepID=A0A543A0S4_9ACTN|nr:hypothetical protein FB381_0012 [Nocardioides albertanoniae]